MIALLLLLCVCVAAAAVVAAAVRGEKVTARVYAKSPAASHGFAFGIGSVGPLFMSDTFGLHRGVYALDYPYTGVPRPFVAVDQPSGLLADGAELLVCDLASSTINAYDMRTGQLRFRSAATTPWMVLRYDDAHVLSLSAGGRIELVAMPGGGAPRTLVRGLLAPFSMLAANASGHRPPPSSPPRPPTHVWVSEQIDADVPSRVALYELASGRRVAEVQHRGAWQNTEGMAYVPGSDGGTLLIADTGSSTLFTYNVAERRLARVDVPPAVAPLQLPVVAVRRGASVYVNEAEGARIVQYNFTTALQ